MKKASIKFDGGFMMKGLTQSDGYNLKDAMESLFL